MELTEVGAGRRFLTPEDEGILNSRLRASQIDRIWIDDEGWVYVCPKRPKETPGSDGIRIMKLNRGGEGS